MAWLDDNPPRHQQFRCPRREPPSGIIGVHTAESFPDETGPDTGAENVARFIRDRTKYGSYHDICDSDSVIHLIRYGCVAYHIATFGINEHSYGVSAATQAHKWNDLSNDWVDATVRNMARASARYAKWLKSNHGITVPAHWLTQSQARNKIPGFVRHSTADPDRRTDPGSSFPADKFLQYYSQEMGNDDMDITDRIKSYVRDGKESIEHALATARRDSYALQRVIRYSGSANQSNQYAKRVGVRRTDNVLHPGSESNPEYDKPVKDQRRASFRWAIERIWKNTWWTLERTRRLESKFDAFISTQDERVQEAVKVALAEHDKRVVQVDIALPDDNDDSEDGEQA